MRKIIFLGVLTFSSIAFAQVNIQSEAQVAIDQQNPFLDASGYVSFENNIGKGLYFPRTDLRTWEFKKDLLGGYNNFKTAFDGMVVYNTGSGKTGNNPETQGIQVDVEPGFYYFFNPEADPNENFGAGATDVSKGKWVRIGGGAATSSSTANKVSGTFNLAVGTNNVVLSAMPEAADIKAIKTINIYRTDENGKLEGGVVANTLYSYDEATKKAVFGTGVISSSLPAGNYAYEVEYIK